MRRYAWVWLAGCIAWTADVAINLLYHNTLHALLAMSVASLFAIAYAFYRFKGR